MSGQGSSNLGDVVDVGTADEVAVIYGIEKGVEYVDSDYTDDTQSLTSSIRQHIVDGGLRYHAYHAGQYAFPNDENEQHRDDLKHNLTLHLCDGKYFLAPIEEVLKNGAQVLDLGKEEFICSVTGKHVAVADWCKRNGQWKVVHRVYVSLIYVEL